MSGDFAGQLSGAGCCRTFGRIQRNICTRFVLAPCGMAPREAPSRAPVLGRPWRFRADRLYGPKHRRKASLHTSAKLRIVLICVAPCDTRQYDGRDGGEHHGHSRIPCHTSAGYRGRAWHFLISRRWRRETSPTRSSAEPKCSHTLRLTPQL